MTNEAGSAARKMGIDDWMNQGQGGNEDYLRNWKEEGGEINVWVVPKSDISTVWRHNWYTISNDGKKVFGWRVNSMEHEKVMEKQYFRDKNTDAREKPPVVCPFSFMIEWVYEQIQAGKIHWCDPIFKFEAKEEQRVVHAGGFTGLFNSKKLSDKQKDEIRDKAGIKLSEAWRYNAMASQLVVFVVVEEGAAEKGLFIAAETRGLGEAFKAEIKRQRTRYGEKNKAKADPFITPTCYSWKLDDSGAVRDFQVAAMEMELTDAVREAFDQDLPTSSIDSLLAPVNIAMLRKNFEDHWCHPRITPPWDDIFNPAMERLKGTPLAVLPESFEPEQIEAGNTSEEAKGNETAAAASSDEPEPSPCDECGKLIPDKVFNQEKVECPHCGVEYEYNEATKVFSPKKKPETEPAPQVEVKSSSYRTSRRKKD